MITNWFKKKKKSPKKEEVLSRASKLERFNTAPPKFKGYEAIVNFNESIVNTEDHHELLTFYVSHFLNQNHNIPDPISLEIMSYLKRQIVSMASFYGTWDWKHDGKSAEGRTITLKCNGRATGTGGTRHVKNWQFIRGFLVVHFNHENWGGKWPHWMKLDGSPDARRLTLYYPIRNPKTIATFKEPLDRKSIIDWVPTETSIEMTEEMMIGKWHWCHDGKKRNGNIILENGGMVSSSMGWSGEQWYICNDVLFVLFNGVHHAMVWETRECKQLVLLEPRRHPRSTAYQDMLY